MARRRAIDDRGKRFRSWITAVVQWWNWRLAVKLIAVLLVPVLAVLALGAWLVGSELTRANSYARVDGLISVKVSAQRLLNDLQDERTMSGQFLSGTGVKDPAALVQQARKVDADKAATDRDVALSHNNDVGVRFADVSRQLESLEPVRQAVRTGTTDAVTAQTQYTSAVSALLRFDQALVSQVGDPGLSSTATALHNLALADEQCALQHAIIAAGAGRGQLLPVEMQRLQASDARWDDRMADFRAVAAPQQVQSYVETVTGPDVEARQGFMRTALAQGPALQIDAPEWNRVSASVRSMHREVQGAGLNQLRAASSGLQDSSSNLAGTEAVILVSLLAVAAAVLTVIGRNLASSLGTLRRTALDVANSRLPSAVAKIRAGRTADTAIEPVAVDTTEEVGQLARAVDTLHGEAVRLAVEQAELRENLNTTFVNVSRRSQSMVEHLLRELDQLERNEQDPDQLSSLFKLDHLATRMRRNNENLVVLSGSDLTRRFTQPLPLGDVLRAAVSEIEQYERVVLRPSPGVRLAGYAVGDLIRLFAELLDNAAAYSSPDTRVTVTSHRARDGRLIVEIADRGIGMSKAELSKANVRLSEGATMDVAVSRQMGLFVVGRLARKHGIHVRLRGGGQGLTAVVSVPEALLAAQSLVTGSPGTTGVTTSAASGQRSGAPELPVREPGSSRRQGTPMRRSGEIRPQISALQATYGGITPDDESPATDLFTAVTPANEPNFEEFSPAPSEKSGNGHSGSRGGPPSAGGVGWFDDAPPLDEDGGGTQRMPPRPTKSGQPSQSAGGEGSSPGPDGWQAARNVAESQPSAHTSAGLPKRQPREHLLPGSAQPSRPPGTVQRAPDELRRRIARFQAGSNDAYSESPQRTDHRSSGPEGRDR